MKLHFVRCSAKEITYWVWKTENKQIKSREWSYFRVKSAAFCSLLGILSKEKKTTQYEKQDRVLGRKKVDMLTVLQ